MKGLGQRACLMAKGHKFIITETVFKAQWFMALSLETEYIRFQMGTYTKDLFTITKVMDTAN